VSDSELMTYFIVLHFFITFLTYHSYKMFIRDYFYYSAHCIRSLLSIVVACSEQFIRGSMMMRHWNLLLTYLLAMVVMWCG